MYEHICDYLEWVEVDLLHKLLHQLERLENKMSDLSDAVAAEQQALNDLAARIANITGPLQAALDAANEQVAALTTDDQAQKDALATALADAQAATTALQSEVAQTQGLAQPPAGG